MTKHMTFLDEERLTFRDSVERYIRDHADPESVREWDERKEFPESVVRGMAEQGWFALTLPEEYGGIGDYLDMTSMLEVIASASITLARFWNINVNMVGGAIAALGAEHLKSDLLPKLAEGKVRFAFALSENNSGSDASALKTRAEVGEDEFIVNGTKMWITGAQQADYILTAVRTDPKATRHDGISLVLIPRDAEGVTVTPIPLLGGHAVRTCEVNFIDVKVARNLMVGDLHTGWKQLMPILAKERVALAAMCTGAGQAATDLAIEYCTQREQFGRRLSAFQAVSHRIVEMQNRTDVARLLTYHAAARLNAGQPCSREASQAKLMASDGYMQTALDGLQVMGANGYSMEYAMQRHFREAKVFQIFGGTSEIQKNIIGKEIGL